MALTNEVSSLPHTVALWSENAFFSFLCFDSFFCVTHVSNHSNIVILASLTHTASEGHTFLMYLITLRFFV